MGGWELVGLQAACVASAGSRDGFVRMSVVLLKLRSELKTTAPINVKKKSLQSPPIVDKVGI